MIPEAPYTLAQLFDAITYGADARASRWVLERFDVISRPREPLSAPLQRGDILLRRTEDEHAHACLVIDPVLRSTVEIALAGGAVEVPAPGQFVFVAERGARPHQEEDQFARRVTDASGRILKRQVVLRPRAPTTEAEGIDPVSLMVGMTLASAGSRTREVSRGDGAASSRGDTGGEGGPSSSPDTESGTQGTEADEADVPLTGWPFKSHRSFGTTSVAESYQARESSAPGEFNSPEHFRLGLAIQDMADLWAKAGLISGGCFVIDTDEAGMPLSLDKWKFFVPDRNRPEQPYPETPYGDARVLRPAHWQWIVPDPDRDASLNYWTPTSLAGAIRKGQAVPLSIGDIVMLSGDLVGEFSDFSAASGRDWRSQPVNIAKGLAVGEPYAMSVARRLQFARTGWDAPHDLQLLARSRSDYAALKKEVASADKTWAAVRLLIAFLRKVRGPSGCSELLVLSRLMRREVITLPTIRSVAPWVTSTDYAGLVRAVTAADLGDMNKMTIDSNLFQSVVTNGWYAELAMTNDKHFSPANWATFEEAHIQALNTVERQVPVTRVTIESAPIPAAAIAQTAYGLHFLSDAFAAGHMRTPRTALGRAGALLAVVMHDFDNNLGLIVENGFAHKWRAFGDSHLDDPTAAQTKLLTSERKVIDSRFDANREHAIQAMGAAMKQLHYQAQRHFGDSANAAEFQGVLGRARGTERGLLYDDAVPFSQPGDGVGRRDAWLAMCVAAKIQFMKKHQPHVLSDRLNWRKALGNHPPLVEVDAGGTVVIDQYRLYSIDQHLPVLYELGLSDAEGFSKDITREVLFSAFTPDAALSWLGTKELWLGKALRTVRDARGMIDDTTKALLKLPSGLP